jgi:hypothetical protein
VSRESVALEKRSEVEIARLQAALTKAEQDIIHSMSEVRRLEIRAQCAEAALADLAEVIEKIARLCALFTRSIK